MSELIFCLLFSNLVPQLYREELCTNSIRPIVSSQLCPTLPQHPDQWFPLSQIHPCLSIQTERFLSLISTPASASRRVVISLSYPPLPPHPDGSFSLPHIHPCLSIQTGRFLSLISTPASASRRVVFSLSYPPLPQCLYTHSLPSDSFQRRPLFHLHSLVRATDLRSS